MADLENTNALTTPDAQPVSVPAEPSTDATVSNDSPSDDSAAPAADAVAPASDAAPPAEGVEDKPKKTPWWEGRIKQTTWEKNEAKRRAETAEAEANVLREQIAAMQRGNADASPQEVQQQQQQRQVPQPILTQADIDRQVEQRFAAKDFADQCNKTYEAGKAEFKDFDAARDQLATNFGDILQGRPDFLEAINAVPGGHKVFYELGMNPETAAHLLTLPSSRLTVELALMGQKLSAPKSTPVSGAPKPITPVGGSAQISNELTDDLPKDEWFKRREEQLKARRTGTR